MQQRPVFQLPAYVHVCMYGCVCLCVCVCVCVCVDACVHASLRLPPCVSASREIHPPFGSFFASSRVLSDRHPSTHTDRHTERHRDRHTDIHTDRHKIRERDMHVAEGKCIINMYLCALLIVSSGCTHVHTSTTTTQINSIAMHTPGFLVCAPM